MIHFAIVVLPGAYHTSIGALIDCYTLVQDRYRHVVREGSDDAQDIDLTLLSVDGRNVEIDSRTVINVDRKISAKDRFDFIWLPAFRARSEEGMRKRLNEGGELFEWMRTQSLNGATIGASGVATLLLMAAHLVEGQRVPVARAVMTLARAIFPRFQREERLAIADYGNILISNGISNDLGLIVRVMERTLSPESSRWLTSVTGLDREERELFPNDPLVAAAQLRLEQQFATGVSISDLAAELSASHPTLIRRFKKALGMTPSAYVQNLRLAAAQRLLANSNRSVDSIAAMVGYSDTRIFRAMFRQKTGLSASAWRAQHQKKS